MGLDFKAKAFKQIEAYFRANKNIFGWAAANAATAATAATAAATAAIAGLSTVQKLAIKFFEQEGRKWKFLASIEIVISTFLN